jgi:hypothetical protein
MEVHAVIKSVITSSFFNVYCRVRSNLHTQPGGTFLRSDLRDVARKMSGYVQNPTRCSTLRGIFLLGYKVSANSVDSEHSELNIVHTYISRLDPSIINQVVRAKSILL